MSTSSLCRMGTQLILRHENRELLEQDYLANLRKGRAYVPGAVGLAERELCTLRLEAPDGAAALEIRAEAVWLDPGQGGTGLGFVDFDASVQSALAAFVAACASPADSSLAASAAPEGPPASTSLASDAAPPGAAPSSRPQPSSSGRNLHDRMRELSIAERDVVARQGSLPERVALERRYGSSVWEGLLHNPQITVREVLRIAKSTSLPTSLVTLVVGNRTWLADPAIQQALLGNPRLSGAHVERVLRAMPQAELARVAEQTSVRIQVRQAAKRLIRR